jgi:DNA polymerase III epsilon subunit-like protein
VQTEAFFVARILPPESRIFLAMLIRETTLTVLDFETTGSVPGFDTEPWQVGAVRLVNGRVDATRTFDRLIRVDINRPFNAYAPGKHHKLREKIAAAETVSKVWKNLEGWVTGGPLVAHNIATEKKFLRQMAPMHRFGPWVDTLTLSRQAWPEAPSHTLEALTGGLGLERRIREICPDGEAHDALYDAVACAVLLEYLLAMPGWDRLGVA